MYRVHKNINEHFYVMKNLKSVTYILSIIILIIAVGIGNASAQGKSHFKLCGKILANKKADITIFQENNNNWSKIRTLKSRSKYNVKLSPEENYYLVFISLDGIKKALYINKGKTGDWRMRLNINFEEWSIKYKTLYHSASSECYKVKVKHKNNEKIIIRDKDLTNIFVAE